MSMEMADKIRKIRKKYGLSQEDLAKKLKMAASSISSWERGANKPMMDKLEKMAEMFNVPISYFFGAEDAEKYADKTILPVYGHISCGNGSVIYEPTTEYEATPQDWVVGGNHFYLRAKGDSMVGARIHEGDLLLIREQPIVENGEIAAVVINDEIVLKRVYRQNGTFILTSENPNYPPRSFDPKEDKHIRILGKLKRSITQY